MGFSESEITLGAVANTPERRDLAKRLFYTWRDCFARTIRDIKLNEPVYYSIK